MTSIPPRVSLASCPDYEFEKIIQALEACLEPFGGMGQIIPQGAKVLIKVNLLNDYPAEYATVTHPLVTKAVIRLVKNAKAVPVVGEQSGPAEKGMTLRAFKRSGTLDVCLQEGVSISVFNEKGHEPVACQSSKHLKSLYVAKDVIESDFVIGIGKLKTHVQTLFSGTIKNYFGCVPLKYRKIAHSLGRYDPVCEAIVDIFQTIRPTFTFLDGIIGMEGRGPSSGNPKRLGVLMAAKDHVACDTVAMQMIGISPGRYHVLTDAHSRGLGEKRINKITLFNGPLSRYSKTFEPPPRFLLNPPSFLAKISTTLFFQKVGIDPALCKSCGICIKSCPADAITITTHAMINYQRCLECLCCMELCPHEAVDEKTSAIIKPLRKIKDFLTPGVSLKKDDLK